MNTSTQKTTVKTPQAKLEEILKLVEYSAPIAQQSQKKISERNTVIQNYIALKQNAYLAQKQLESNTYTFDQIAEHYHDIDDRLLDHQTQNQDQRDRLNDLLEKRTQTVDEHSEEQQDIKVKIDKTLEDILKTLFELEVFTELFPQRKALELSDKTDSSRQSIEPEVLTRQEKSAFSSQLLNQIAAATHELQIYGKFELKLSELEGASPEEKILSKQKALKPLSPDEIESLQKRLTVQLRDLYNQRNTLQLTEEQQTDSIEIIDLKISQHRKDIQNTNDEIEAIESTLNSTKQKFNQISEDWDQSVKQQIASHEELLQFVLEMRSHLPLATQEDLINNLYLNIGKTLRTIESSLTLLKQNDHAEENQSHPKNYSDAIQTLKTINHSLSPFLTEEGILIGSSEGTNTNNLAMGLQQNYENTTQEILQTLESDSLEDWLKLKQNIINDFQQRSTHWSTHLAEGHSQTQTLLSHIKERSESLDKLTEKISQNLSGPLSDYKVSQLALQKAVDISDVAGDRYDALQNTLDANTDRVAQIKLLIGQTIESQEVTEHLFHLLQSEIFYEDLLNAKDLLASKDPHDQSKAQDLMISLAQDFIEYLDPDDKNGIALSISLEEAVTNSESLKSERVRLEDAFEQQTTQLRTYKADIIDLEQEYSDLKNQQESLDYQNNLGGRPAQTSTAHIFADGIDSYQIRSIALKNEIRSTKLKRDSIQEQVNETAQKLDDNYHSTINTRISLFDETEAVIGPFLQKQLINEILQLPHRLDIQNKDITTYLEQQIDDLVQYEKFYQDLLNAKELFISGENIDQINAQNIVIALTQNLIKHLDPTAPETALLVKGLEQTTENAERLTIERESLNSGYADQTTRLRSYKAKLIDLEQEIATSKTFALIKEVRDTTASRDVTQKRVNDLAQNISENHQSAIANHANLLTQVEDVIEPFLKEQLSNEHLDFPHVILSNLQQLKLKTAYLFTQSPDIIQATVNGEIDSIIPPLDLYPGTSAFLLEEISQSLLQFQQRDAELKISQNENNAAAAAFVSQADWYDEQSAIHWDKSRKQGPTWSERRVTYKRDKCGKKKRHTVNVQHTDHDWIIWDNYSKLSIDLREQAEQAMGEVEQAQLESKQLLNVINAWNETQNIANQALNSEIEFKLFIDQLQVAQNKLGEYQTFLETLEVKLIPQLEDDYQTSETTWDNATAELQSEWKQLGLAAGEWTEALAFITQDSSEFLQIAQASQLQIEDIEEWAKEQSSLLELELTQTIDLTNQLQNHRDKLKQDLTEFNSREGNVGKVQDLLPHSELESRIIILEEMLQLLIGKTAILNAQKSSLVQKQATLQAQQYVITAESELLEAYLKAPDAEFENLQAQLESVRIGLDELQVLGDDAELSSQGLSTSLQELQIHLQLRNDRQLDTVREKQNVFNSILEKTELSTFYTNEAALKQEELNALESQVYDRLEEAKLLGNQEAIALLEVARLENLATAAEIYFNDYQDLSQDQGGSCAGGISRASDRILADQYYQEWQKYEQLQTLASAQVSHFQLLRNAAEETLAEVESTKFTLSQELVVLNHQIANHQDETQQLQYDLILLEEKQDWLSQIQQLTQQTLHQVIEIEHHNLRLAELQQNIAQAQQDALNQNEIEHLKRERLELDHEWKLSAAKIELLKQLQTEDSVQEILNDVRLDLNLHTFEDIINSAETNIQINQLSAEIDSILSEQPTLPNSITALLQQTQQDLSQVIQGEAGNVIQARLVTSIEGLITEANRFQSDLNKLDVNEQRDQALLQKADLDLQGAISDYIVQVEQGDLLEAEQKLLTQENLEILYRIGLAEQAVDVSEALTNQSKALLQQILGQRVEERKARKKFFLNDLMSSASTVLRILSFIPSPFSLPLKWAATAISASQSAYNGDWSSAIFSATMGAANFTRGAIQEALQNGEAEVLGMAQDVAREVKSTIETLQPIASGAFNAIRASQSEDSVGAFLHTLGALSSVALDHIPSDQNSIVYQLVNSSRTVPLSIHAGLQALESENTLAATSHLFNGVISLGQNFANTLIHDSDQSISKTLNTVDRLGNISLAIANVIENDSHIGWLSAIENVLASEEKYHIHSDRLQAQEQSKITLSIPELKAIAEQQGLPPENVWRDQEGQVYLKNSIPLYGQEINLVSLGEIDHDQSTRIFIHGWNDSTQSEDWIDIAKTAQVKYPDENIILIDWSQLSSYELHPLSSTLYIPATFYTKKVGEEIAEYLTGKIDFSTTTVIGHSLGAQVGAGMGEFLQGSLKKLVPLDPASPQYEKHFLWWGENSSTDGSISQDDAQFVEAIHSDYEGLFHLGYNKPVGTEGLLGYKAGENGLEVLNSSDIYIGTEIQDYYQDSINHSDAVRLYRDFLKSSHQNFTDFFKEFYETLIHQNSQSSDASLPANNSIPNSTNNTDSLELLNQRKSEKILMSDNSIPKSVIDTLSGDDGNNRLIGGDRNDRISGQAGNNLIRGALGADRLDGGAGFDRLDYTTSNAGVTVNLGSKVVSGGHADGDSITDFEAILGSKYGDQLTGDAGKNFLWGRHGNDILAGAGGNDILRGDQGADILTGGSGANTFKYKGRKDSLLSNIDRITDLKIGIDRIDSPIKVSADQVAQLQSIVSLEIMDLKSLLSSGAFRPNRAATFTHGNQTFLAINDDKAGFQAHKDSVIEITGFSGELNNLSIS